MKLFISMPTTYTYYQTMNARSHKCNVQGVVARGVAADVRAANNSLTIEALCTRARSAQTRGSLRSTDTEKKQNKNAIRGVNNNNNSGRIKKNLKNVNCGPEEAAVWSTCPSGGRVHGRLLLRLPPLAPGGGDYVDVDVITMIVVIIITIVVRIRR